MDAQVYYSRDDLVSLAGKVERAFTLHPRDVPAGIRPILVPTAPSGRLGYESADWKAGVTFACQCFLRALEKPEEATERLSREGSEARKPEANQN